jgi:hypothetical protein
LETWCRIYLDGKSWNAEDSEVAAGHLKVAPVG